MGYEIPSYHLRLSPRTNPSLRSGWCGAGMNKMRYCIITYGCQMNRSDSERIASVLENIGYLPASNVNKADVIVVNMCSVRQSAVDRIYSKLNQISKIKNQNDKVKGKIILTGCILPKDKNKLKNQANLILDIKDLPKLPERLLTIQQFNNLTIKDRGLQNESYLKIESKYSNNFSAYVPIVTGCNNFCSFCVVPYTRGREISRPAEEIICEVENLAKRDYKEIWLLGQNVNSYKSGKINFPKLLEMVNDIPGNFWIRFTSSHPKDFSDELIEVMANCEKVTEYLNLPVQSGDNEILKKMNRPYIIKEYKEIVKKIREKIPNITLSTDVIVGFPGETEKQFQNTLLLFKEIKYDMAYIAQYSPRPGTAAFKLENNVSHREKERRWKILADILRKTALGKNKSYIGKNVEVLVDNHKNGFLFGKTRNYKTVKFKGPSDLIGQFAKAKIIGALSWGLKGKLLS